MEENKNETSSRGNDKMLPASIIIAAVLIMVGLVYNAGKKDLSAGNQANQLAAAQNQPTQETGSPEKVRAFSKEDHVLGDPNAPVKFIMFSDFECPYCKTFHETVKKLSTEYEGRVAFVFRQFPMHSKSGTEAVATECAASFGGSEKFWAFADEIFATTPSNDGLDLAQLPKIAVKLGFDEAAFNTCLKSGKFEDRIKADMKDASAAGLQGTPYTVIVAPSGNVITVNGAYPYEAVKEKIEQALKLK
ncbi:MAG: thioredoxin domain-containing protein [Candidatus Jorgensenbacteria bacterium]|nr:thioredoxin domain-containing protein [Candidatus Jorgensenbacteria bacterium]